MLLRVSGRSTDLDQLRKDVPDFMERLRKGGPNGQLDLSFISWLNTLGMIVVVDDVYYESDCGPYSNIPYGYFDDEDEDF